MAALVAQQPLAGPGPSSSRLQGLLRGSGHAQHVGQPCCGSRLHRRSSCSQHAAARLQHHTLGATGWPTTSACCHAAASAAGASHRARARCPSSSWSQQQQQQQRQQRGLACSSCASRPPHAGSCSPVSPVSLGAAPPLRHTGARRPGLLPPAGASLALVEPAAAAAGAGAVAAAGGSKAGAGAAAAAAAGVGGFSFSQVLAVVLGYAVMAGSLFRSVPQIVKVVQHNSTEGLSLTSYLVELCCYSVVIAYNMAQGYGFNTFGEVVACWVQDVILIGLVFRDRRAPPWAVAATAAAVAAGCAFLLSPACPLSLLAAMQASNIAVMALGSRLPQIVLNMRRGNAGMLSVTTCLLNVAGNAARIFTTLVLTGDMLMLGGACSQGCLNTILLCQSVSTARARSRAAKAGGSSSSSSSSSVKQPEPEPPAGGLPALQPAT